MRTIVAQDSMQRDFLLHNPFGVRPMSVERPRLLAYRCRAVAKRPHRCGAVVALASGLGNDKAPFRFTESRDPTSGCADWMLWEWPFSEV